MVYTRLVWIPTCIAVSRHPRSRSDWLDRSSRSATSSKGTNVLCFAVLEDTSVLCSPGTGRKSALTGCRALLSDYHCLISHPETIQPQAIQGRTKVWCIGLGTYRYLFDAARQCLSQPTTDVKEASQVKVRPEIGYFISSAALEAW